MRIRRAKSRTTPRLANVIEYLESRCLLSGAGDLVGDNQATATNLGILSVVPPREVVGTIDVAFDRDVYQFQSESAGTTTVELGAHLSVLDAFVTVRNSLGVVIASDDDSGPGTDSRLVFATDAGGIYFVEAREFGSRVGEYTLRLTLVPDVGDTVATAQDSGHLTAANPLVIRNSVDRAFDRDVFQFQADSAGSTLVQLNSEFGTLDPFVTVLNSSGIVIAFDDDSGPGLNSLLTFTVEQGETYFVEARGFSTSFGSYSLHISFDVGFPPETAINLGSLTAAQPLMAIGNIAALETHDLFLFTAQEDGTVEVQQVAAPVIGFAFPFDGVLQVFDVGSSLPLATNFRSADTSIPRVVTFSVVAGQRYFAEVTGFSGSTGNYQLTVNYVVDDVPAAGVDLGVPDRSQTIQRRGSIELSGDIDTYRLTADASQTLVITLDATTGSGLDPILEVRVFSSGRLLRTFQNDDVIDFRFSLNSFLSVAVLRGQVVEIDARGFQSRQGGYLLKISDDKGFEVFPQSPIDDDRGRGFRIISSGVTNRIDFIRSGTGASGSTSLMATATTISRILKGRAGQSDIVLITGIEDSTIVPFEDVLQQSIGRKSDDSKFGDGVLGKIPFAELASLFEAVLAHLQFEGLSQQSFARIVERLRGSDSKVPMELMKNASIVRSVNAMYDVMSLGANWFGGEKRKPPVQKPRSPMPKVSQESSEPKSGFQTGGRSTKSRQMGG